MDYEVIITKRAEESLNAIIDYFSITIMNAFARKKFYKDFISTLDFLKDSPRVMQLSKNPKLNKMGYRMIKLSKYKYLVLYTIDENIVYIQDIIHQSQNYEVKQNNWIEKG